MSCKLSCTTTTNHGLTLTNVNMWQLISVCPSALFYTAYKYSAVMDWNVVLEHTKVFFNSQHTNVCHMVSF